MTNPANAIKNDPLAGDWSAYPQEHGYKQNRDHGVAQAYVDAATPIGQRHSNAISPPARSVTSAAVVNPNAISAAAITGFASADVVVAASGTASSTRL